MPVSGGRPGRRGARRPDGTFAEALFAVPPFGAGPPAAALIDVEDGPKVDLRSGTASYQCYAFSIASTVERAANGGAATAPQGQPSTRLKVNVRNAATRAKRAGHRIGAVEDGPARAARFCIYPREHERDAEGR
jgi:hypothetical protein